MKLKFLLFALLICLKSFSQGEASNWFFGNRAGIRFNNDNSISVLSGNPNPISINTNEGCSSYSDELGNLLMYTDGRTVWDKNHKIMPNGDYYNNTGLLGDPSSTQSGIIVPNPINPNIYYIFTVDEPHHTNASVYPNQYTGSYSEGQGNNQTIPDADDGYNNGLNYSIVDLSISGSNGSIGDITVRNTHLVTYDPDPTGIEIKYKCSEKITAVKTRDGLGYWVITHFADKFYAFKIDRDGVTPTPIISQIAPLVPITGYRRNAIGQLKISPNGKKLAVAHNQLATTEGAMISNGVVYLYDFNNQTGSISNPNIVIENANPYGLEFSPKATKLYVSTSSALLQFDLEASPIIASQYIVAYRGNGSLQLGPDKKIYKANPGERSLDVVNYPELTGTASRFEQRAVSLGNGSSNLGLPPFITSVFSSDILASNFCLSNPTTFSLDVDGTVDSVIWNFGDGSLTTSTNSPNHTYLSPGNYTVQANIIIEGNSVVSKKTIQISALPTAVPSTLTQCSPDGSQTNVLFDLKKANKDLTANLNERTTSFFLLKSDAENNINQQDTIFRNTSNPQILFAKVTDSRTGCFSIAELTLFVNIGPTYTYSIDHCDDDGLEDGLYNFTLADAQIASDFPPLTTISYYKDIDDALLEQNELGNQFTNTSLGNQIIYAKATGSGTCLGIFPIHLRVLELPKIELATTDYVCTNLPNQYTTLTAEILSGNISSLQFDWSSGEKTSSIRVNQPGTYTVKVTNALGCEKIRTITVFPSNNATISAIDIVDNSENNTATVQLTDSSIGNYLYSIDAPSGPFQVSNHFENIKAGFHTIYVYDDRGCGTVSQEISILKIPKFFTPNGDGRNDTWDIVGMSPKFYVKSKIYIFDRFGKLLADINPLSNGWNGIFNGQPLPSSDYWYVINLDNGRTIKGHFSLVR